MMDFRGHCVLIFVVLLGFNYSVSTLSAQDKSLKPGINDSYKKIKIEGAVKRFEAEKRDVVKKRDEIVAACRLKPGMVLADVGAGTGLFTRLFAPKVAPKGKVYAVDITEEFVKHVKKTCKDEEINNVVCVISSPTSAKLEPGSTDLVFTCDTYHHFEFPFKMLGSIHEALRPSGRLIIVDRKHASDHVRADQATVKKEVLAAGFKFLDEKNISEREYLMRFERVDRAPQ